MIGKRPPKRRARDLLVLVAVAALVAVVLGACGGDSDKVVVPEVEGLTVNDAVDRVCSRFLVPAFDEPETSGAGTEPMVLSSDPAAGTEAEVGSTVTLRVSAPEGNAFLPAPGCDSP